MDIFCPICANPASVSRVDDDLGTPNISSRPIWIGASHNAEVAGLNPVPVTRNVRTVRTADKPAGEKRLAGLRLCNRVNHQQPQAPTRLNNTSPEHPQTESVTNRKAALAARKGHRGAWGVAVGGSLAETCTRGETIPEGHRLEATQALRLVTPDAELSTGMELHRASSGPMKLHRLHPLLPGQHHPT